MPAEETEDKEEEMISGIGHQTTAMRKWQAKKAL